MKRTICLHGLRVKGPEELRECLHGFLPRAAARSRVYEKSFSDNDMCEYRQLTFKPAKGEGIAASCMWGEMLACGRSVPISDIKVSFDTESARQVIETEHLLKGLLSSGIEFMLTEPDMAARVSYLRGNYGAERAEAARGSVAYALYAQLPRQLFLTGLSLQQLFEREADMGAWRRLRVRLRSLRSFIALLKPLLPQVRTAVWQGILRRRAGSLSRVRELDAAIASCNCLSFGDAGARRRATHLIAVLKEIREREAKASLGELDRNELTLELTEMLLGVYCAPAQDAAEGLREFYLSRFGAWSAGILAKAQEASGFSDMYKLHELRIKLKRFRFALLCAEGSGASDKFLRSLKRLVDDLGRLHDCHTERELLHALALARPDDGKLRLESEIFLGAESEKALELGKRLPCEWEKFRILLAEWQASAFSNGSSR